MNNIFVSQWQKFWELNFNFLSQCRKTYENEKNNNFDSQCQIFESWITFCPTASEKIWGEKQLCLTVPKTLRVELQFCLRMSKKSLRPITNFCHSVEKFKIWLTFLSQIAESFESWIRRLSHYIEEFLRWITCLYLSDEIF